MAVDILTADYLETAARTIRDLPLAPIERAVDLLLRARAAGQRVYVLGNGGSASTASHFVCDLTKGARVRGYQPVRAFSLADNVATMTALGNDISFRSIFSEQLDGLLEPDDLVIVISVSGSSPNLIEGLDIARRRGATTIGLLGMDGGRAISLVDVAIHVKSHEYGVVESVHLTVAHAIAVAVRRTLEQERDRVDRLDDLTLSSMVDHAARV